MRTTLFLLAAALSALSAPTAFAKGDTSFVASFAIGIPHPLNLGLDLKHQRFSEGLGLGTLSVTTTGTTPVTVKMDNYEVRGRWHPFGGSFILGAAFGYQNLSGSTTQSFTPDPLVGPIPTTIKLAIKSPYVTPHMGWMWIFGSGFTLGFELGVQIPFSPSSTLDVSVADPTQNSYLDQIKQLPNYQDAQSKVTDNSDKYGRMVLPYTTLLRLGWAF